MTTTVNLRKILDVKRWEVMNNTRLSWSGGGVYLAPSYHYKQLVFYSSGGSFHYIYNVEEDATIQVPSPTVSFSTWGSGTSTTAVCWSTGPNAGGSAAGATAGTTSTITTGLTLRRDLRGWPIMIMAGPNAGQVLTIQKNTVGANSVITVPTQPSAFSNATTFRLMTPRWFVIGASSGTSTGMQFFDYATYSWRNVSSTGLPTTFGTDAVLVSTPSWIEDGFNSMATGTATSATSTTLVNSGKSWTSGQWVNYQIRITGGTGAGQIRTITANDATSVTVATWTVTPDSTSTYSIEGNDDFLYLMGNNAVTLYRYSISSDSWTTLSPSVARAAAPGIGLGGNWISQSTDADWTNESSIINGRRIYSSRGGTSSVIDYYDIPSNSWTNSIIYPESTWEFFGSVSGQQTVIKDKIYMLSNGSTFTRFDTVTSDMVAWMQFPIMTDPQFSPTQYVGRMTFRGYYKDGDTRIDYFYMVHPQSSYLLRCVVI